MNDSKLVERTRADMLRMLEELSRDPRFSKEDIEYCRGLIPNEEGKVKRVETETRPMFSDMARANITSTLVIQRLKKNNPDSITIAEMVEIHQIIVDMPELEAFRILVWLVNGPMKTTRIAHSLMDFLGKDEALYKRFLRWIAAHDIDPSLSVLGKCPVIILEGVTPAYEANGFKSRAEFVKSTIELVSCV